MNLLRICIIAFGVLWISNPAFTQEKTDPAIKTDTLKLSLSQAQQFAMENNQSILNANLDIEAAKKKVWETTTIGLPQVNGKLGFQYTPELTSISSINNLFGWMYDADQALLALQPSNGKFGHIPDPGDPIPESDMKWSLAGTITASQLIFSGSYLVGLQSAKVYKSLSELNQVKSKQDILESVVNSYVNVLIARENMVILDSTYNNLTKTFSDMQAMGAQGFIEETDIDQMQITVSTVKSSLDYITRMVGVAEMLLKIQLGLDLQKPLVLTDNLAPIIDGITIEKLVAADFVLENNVNYKMLDTQVKASQLLLKLRKSEFLPDIAAFYQYQKEFNDNAFTFTPPHVIGVQMNIPIFGSGQKLARVSQAKIEVLKAQNTKTQMSNNLKLDYYNSKSALLNAYDKYATESGNIKLAKRIYDKALIKYTNGVISGTDLSQIQNQYLTAQSNYYQALQDLISSKSKLEKVLSSDK
jgi:outer membrane protein TolC